MTTTGVAQTRAAFRAVNDLLQHRDLLPGPLAEGLSLLRRQLSEQMCPFTTRELEAARKKLDERFPGYEHWYIRCGTTVTWCSKPRQQPTPGR